MAFLANVPVLSRILGLGPDANAPAVRVRPLPVHPIEHDHDKGPRTLKHLLRANHVHHALVAETESGEDSTTTATSTLAYGLSAAFLLGADAEHLHALYDALAPGLPSWTPSPAEVTDGDWRAFFGDVRYQRAYVDFFEDKLAEHSVAYDWRRVVATYLWEDGGDEGDDRAATTARPLLHGLFAADGLPLRYLACAYELDSRVLAMEALALAAVLYGEGGTTKEETTTTGEEEPKSVFELLTDIMGDPRLKGVPKKAAPSLPDDPPAIKTIVREYGRAWPPPPTTTTGMPPGNNDDHLTDCLRDAQHNMAALVSACPYSAALAHALVAVHALRVLLPHAPRRCHAPLLRQWWRQLAVSAFLRAGRPMPDPTIGWDGRDAPKEWALAKGEALRGPWRTDADFLLVVRALRAAADTWGEREGYVGAASRFVNDFKGWRYDGEPLLR